MRINIIPKHKLITNRWSGGTTTELFIFPASANYEQRNFDFRLSTATVEVENSVFTALPGISRTLMVLDGEMTLQHQDHHSSKLIKFDIDMFEGGWKTSSEGTCTDLNLMTTGDNAGNLIPISINAQQQTEFNVKPELNWLIAYVYSGDVSIEYGNKDYKATKSDVVVVEQPTSSTLKINTQFECELVFLEVKLR